MLTSCSSDDSSSDSSVDTTIKPTKMVFKGPDNSVIYVRDIKYDGNKILSTTDDDGYVFKYTYTGNEITKVEEFTSFTVLDRTTEYKYLNGKMVTEIQTMPNQSSYYEIKYTYNTDGTISYESKNVIAGGSSLGKFTYKNGNMIKGEHLNKGEVDGSTVYEYDAKKNPMSNVTGINLLISRTDISANNMTKLIMDSPAVTTTFSYLYNNNDFPTEQKRFDKAGKLEAIIQYTY